MHLGDDGFPILRPPLSRRHATMSVPLPDDSWAVDERSLKAFADKLKRSEEHTSELQSPVHLVCRLLLEKKKKIPTLRLMIYAVLTIYSSILSDFVCLPR